MLLTSDRPAIFRRLCRTTRRWSSLFLHSRSGRAAAGRRTGCSRSRCTSWFTATISSPSTTARARRSKSRRRAASVSAERAALHLRVLGDGGSLLESWRPGRRGGQVERKSRAAHRSPLLAFIARRAAANSLRRQGRGTPHNLRAIKDPRVTGRPAGTNTSATCAPRSPTRSTHRAAKERLAKLLDLRLNRTTSCSPSWRPLLPASSSPGSSTLGLGWLLDRQESGCSSSGSSSRCSGSLEPDGAEDSSAHLTRIHR